MRQIVCSVLSLVLIMMFSGIAIPEISKKTIFFETKHEQDQLYQNLYNQYYHLIFRTNER